MANPNHYTRITSLIAQECGEIEFSNPINQAAVCFCNFAGNILELAFCHYDIDEDDTTTELNDLTDTDTDAYFAKLTELENKAKELGLYEADMLDENGEIKKEYSIFNDFSLLNMPDKVVEFMLAQAFIEIGKHNTDFKLSVTPSHTRPNPDVVTDEYTDWN